MYAILLMLLLGFNLGLEIQAKTVRGSFALEAGVSFSILFV
jgi:hypothetical protein